MKKETKVALVSRKDMELSLAVFPAGTYLELRTPDDGLIYSGLLEDIQKIAKVLRSQS